MQQKFVFFYSLLLLVASCTPPSPDSPSTPRSYTEAEVKVETEKAMAFFEKSFQEILNMSPELRGRLGEGQQDNDKWDELTEDQYERKLRLSEKQLDELRKSINFDALDPQAKLSYKLFEKDRENDIAMHRFRHFNYPVNQMYGVQSEVVSFLLNYHEVKTLADADAYLMRLQGIKTKFEQLVEQLKIREEEGVILPKAIFPLVLGTCQNIITGYPFDGKPESPNTLYADFEKKYQALSAEEKAKGPDKLAECAKALTTYVKPAYEMLITFLKDQEARAPEEIGVWRFPEGEDYYGLQLGIVTTTSLSAEEIHEIGLTEVTRIQEEMKAIMPKVNFKGTLPEFFQFIRGGKQFFYPNTPAGVSAYLTDTRTIVDNMRTRLDEFFITKPKAPLEVRSVEEYRNKAAGKAFYEGPSSDGKRPGIYYVNTYDMSVVPKYSMEALAYHEAIPGHHMQVALAQELESLPKFRRFLSDYTAYVEGWGLYAEKLAKEMGFYKDPYSDFGRLSMELFRACRLVVETGIHSKKWTRQQGIDFYLQNTPEGEASCTKMVDRHIVMPGQATAYKIGMIRLLELRGQAQEALGEKFNIREFHDLLLTSGALPLDVLEELVEEYTRSKK